MFFVRQNPPFCAHKRLTRRKKLIGGIVAPAAAKARTRGEFCFSLSFASHFAHSEKPKRNAKHLAKAKRIWYTVISRLRQSAEEKTCEKRSSPMTKPTVIIHDHISDHIPPSSGWKQWRQEVRRRCFSERKGSERAVFQGKNVSVAFRDQEAGSSNLLTPTMKKEGRRLPFSFFILKMGWEWANMMLF